MLLSLLKLNVVANVDGKRWLGQLIYETLVLKNQERSYFHKAIF